MSMTTNGGENPTAGQPLPAHLRAQGIVKRSVDFNRVKEFGEVSGGVKSARARRGIDEPVPIGVRPARRAHKNIAGRGDRFGF